MLRFKTVSPSLKNQYQVIKWSPTENKKINALFIEINVVFSLMEIMIVCYSFKYLFTTALPINCQLF